MKKTVLLSYRPGQVIRLPKGFEFPGVSELEITKEGDALVLRPVRKSWESFASLDNADAQFLLERPPVLGPE